MTLRLQPIAAQRERNRLIRAHAERVASAAIAEQAESPIPLAVVPANTRETEPLPPLTRQRFLDRLREIVEVAFAAAAPSADASTGVVDAQHDAALARQSAGLPTLPLDLDAILGRSCATCRGECCTAGGDHAFLRNDSILRIRAEQPDVDAASLLAQYVHHLPVRHYCGSCVYHTTTGCTLPREIRSSLCNRYVCGGLTQLTNALAETASRRVFVGAADSVHLRRMALVDETSARPIPLTLAADLAPDAA